jgi:hypothetical protein
MEGGGSQVFTTVFTQMQNERAIAAIFGLEGVSGSSAHHGYAGRIPVGRPGRLEEVAISAVSTT